MKNILILFLLLPISIFGQRANTIIDGKAFINTKEIHINQSSDKSADSWGDRSGLKISEYKTVTYILGLISAPSNNPFYNLSGKMEFILSGPSTEILTLTRNDVSLIGYNSDANGYSSLAGLTLSNNGQFYAKALTLPSVTITSTGTYTFENCSFNGTITINGAGTIIFKNCYGKNAICNIGAASTVYFNDGESPNINCSITGAKINIINTQNGGTLVLSNCEYVLNNAIYTTLGSNITANLLNSEHHSNIGVYNGLKSLNITNRSSTKTFTTDGGLFDLSSISSSGGSNITASNNQVIYKNNSGNYVGSNNLIFNGTKLSVDSITTINSDLKAANKVFATNGTVFDLSTLSNNGAFLPLNFTTPQTVTGATGKKLKFAVDSLNFTSKNIGIYNSDEILVKGYGATNIDASLINFNLTRTNTPSNIVLPNPSGIDKSFLLKSDLNDNIIISNWAGKVGFNSTLAEINGDASSYRFKALSPNQYTSHFTGGKGFKLDGLGTDNEAVLIKSNLSAFNAPEGVFTVTNEQGSGTGANGDVTFFKLQSGATNPAIGDGITTFYGIRGLDGTNEFWQSARHVVQTSNSVVGDITKHSAVQRFYVTHNLSERIGLEIYGEDANNVAKIKTQGVKHFEYAEGTATDGVWATNGTILPKTNLNIDLNGSVFTSNSAVGNYTRLKNTTPTSIANGVKTLSLRELVGQINPGSGDQEMVLFKDGFVYNGNYNSEYNISLIIGANTRKHVFAVDQNSGIYQDAVTSLTTVITWLNNQSGDQRSARTFYINDATYGFRVIATATYTQIGVGAGVKKILFHDPIIAPATELNNIRSALTGNNCYNPGTVFIPTETIVDNTISGNFWLFEKDKQYTWSTDRQNFLSYSYDAEAVSMVTINNYITELKALPVKPLIRKIFLQNINAELIFTNITNSTLNAAFGSNASGTADDLNSIITAVGGIQNLQLGTKFYVTISGNAPLQQRGEYGVSLQGTTKVLVRTLL